MTIDENELTVPINIRQSIFEGKQAYVYGKIKMHIFLKPVFEMLLGGDGTEHLLDATVWNWGTWLWANWNLKAARSKESVRISVSLVTLLSLGHVLLFFPFPLRSTFYWHVVSVPTRLGLHKSPVAILVAFSLHHDSASAVPMPMAQFFLFYTFSREEPELAWHCSGTESHIASQAEIITWPPLQKGHFPSFKN